MFKYWQRSEFCRIGETLPAFGYVSIFFFSITLKPVDKRYKGLCHDWFAHLKSLYRGTIFIRKCPPPWDPRRGLCKVLL